MPNSSDIPVWMQVLRLVITFTITAGFGIHSFASYRTHIIAARKWMYLLFSLVFLFTTQVTFVYLIISLQMGGYMRGPFKLGMLNLLLILSYMGLNYGVGKRKLFWETNGQDRMI